ncbi:hypothetical protein GCM10027435_24020 [Haloparvum alkalitolerans]|uniref:CPBP family intramembrane glutamic endopeptidase n=1 Tax=Haloparvum alkalitolerans TaxID=1042953 RepID=UPI003CF7EBC5
MDILATLRRAAWHGGEARVRAPLRLGVGTLLLFAVAVAVVLVLGASGLVAPAGGGLALTGVVSLLATVGGLALAARFVDRRRWTDYGLRIDRAWWVDFGFGLALGAGLQTGIFLVGWGAGWYVPTGTFVSEGSFVAGFAVVLFLFLSVGIYEELISRGWLLTNVAEGLRFAGDRTAVVVATVASSAVFGVLHATNPGATALSTAIIGLAGVFLALGYVLTGELAIPIGVHVTWNLVQGGVYGFGVSGLGVPATVVETRVTGPELVTGGSFGPEAGLLGLAGILVGSAATAWWVRYRTGAVRVHPSITEPDLLPGGEE